MNRESIRRTRRHRARQLMQLLDGLERRDFFTVDLSGSFTTFPIAALSGSTQAVSVSVFNGGTTKANSPVVFDMYISPDGTPFDVHTATSLGPVSRAVSIGAGLSQQIDSSVKLSASLVAGNYRLYAVLDPDGKVAETDESNNLVISSVLAIVQPNYDLVASFADGATLVPSVVVNQKTNATLPVVIMNASDSTVSLPANLSVAVQIVARPVGVLDASQDLLLNTKAVNVGVSNLAPGGARQQSVSIQFPSTLAQGNYNILVKADTGNALPETDETNNDSTFDHPVSVAPPFSDPTLAFNPATVIPPNVVADGRPLPLKFDFTNQGNITIPAGATGSLTVVAHNVDTATDTTLKVFTVPLGGLGPGKLKTLTFTPTVITTLSNGHYTFTATLATGIAGDVITNNSDSKSDTMLVGTAYFNLGATPADSLIPQAVLVNTPTPGFINVGVKNLGNSFLPPGSRANIQLALRPVGVFDDSQDIPIGSGKINTAGLPAGATQKARLSATIPAKKPNGDPVALGNYSIVTKVTPVNFTDSLPADNVSFGSPITVADPFVDLSIQSATNRFPVPSPIGSSSTGTVVLKNTGNLTVQKTVTIQFFATPTDDVDDGVLIGSQSFFVLLPPGAVSGPLQTALTLNTPANGFLTQDYTIYARIDPASFSDAIASNNIRAAGPLVVSSQSVQLKITGANNPFGGNAVGGESAVAHVTIGNFGSGISAGTVTITYYASLDNTLDGADLVIGTQDVDVNIGAAQLSAPVNVTLTLPNPDSQTTYKLFAKITSSLSVDNNPNDNSTPVIGTVVVTPVVII